MRGKSDEIDGDARRWGGNFTDRARRNLKGIINAPGPVSLSNRVRDARPRLVTDSLVTLKIRSLGETQPRGNFSVNATSKICESVTVLGLILAKDHFPQRSKRWKILCSTSIGLLKSTCNHGPDIVIRLLI